MRRGLLRRRRCGTTHHLWNKDFRALDLSRTAFMRVDCLRCGAAIDGVKAKVVYDELGMTFGSFADPDDQHWTSPGRRAQTPA